MDKKTFPIRSASVAGLMTMIMMIVSQILVLSSLIVTTPVYAQNNSGTLDEAPNIVLKDKSLVAQPYVSGLNSPMTMAFVGGKDLLVLERTAGTVRLIRDGHLQPEPVLSLNVSSVTFEEGLVGIFAKDPTVYLDFTTRDSNNNVTTWFYKYSWDGSKLIDPTLLKEIPGGNGLHNGGAMISDANGTVYGIMGDQWYRRGVTQNHPEGGGPDDTSVIFPLESGSSYDYYAIGIRVSLGLAIDPVTGYMWDSEDGGSVYDEINLVTPKFNSGWDVIQGPANSTQLVNLSQYDGYTYHDPKFSWELPVGVVAPTFIRSNTLKECQNSVLVGAYHSGAIYELKLNENRTGFKFANPSLVDSVLNRDDDPTTILFASGFAGVTDIEEGPDGLIYVVSVGDGTIYKISARDAIVSSTA
ncbi:MAG: PQQ-dependent sugar dehydrogenase [Thermoproteota archaeon]|nr:PQQ-dependent sugar dehydrogenase [Thermoproteota archaeon]